MAKKVLPPGASLAFPPTIDPIGAINPALAKSDPAVMVSSTPFGPFLGTVMNRYYVKSAVKWKRNPTAYPNQAHLNELRRWAGVKDEYGVVIASINGRLVVVPRHAAETARRAGARVEIIAGAPSVAELIAPKAIPALAAP